MREAIIAVEDRRFRSHPGVDPIGMVRATWLRITEGRWRQGGSTITQQLARNIFLNNDRTFARKIREGILALALEWQFSKEQILELYLNRVYFGGGAYGIDAASRRFFGHSATQLSVGEAAIIAGLVKAPSNYSPTADIAAARGPRPGRARPDGREWRDHPGAGRRRRSGRHPARPGHTAAGQQPLFHRLGAAAARHLDRREPGAARRLDDDRSRHAARRQRFDQRQYAAGRAGRAGHPRPGRRGAGDGRRARLYRLQLQSRDPGEPAGGLLVQTVRLSDRAGGGLPTGYERPGRADHDRRLVAAQQQRPLSWARSRCASPSPIR